MIIVNQIDAALAEQAEIAHVIGLRALKEIARGFSEEIEDDERKPLNALAEKFLPKLE